MSANEHLIALTADIVSSHLSNNNVAVGDVPTLIQQVHGALAGLNAPVEEEAPTKSPAVSLRASIKPDHLVCLECGKRRKTLKRHLQTAHGVTPEQYRADYRLPHDYPLVSANYSARRSEMARAIGFGTKSRIKGGPKPASAPTASPKSRARRSRKAPAGV